MAHDKKTGDEVYFYIGGDIPEDRKNLLGTPNDQATLQLLRVMGFQEGSLKVVEQSGDTRHFTIE